MVTSRPSRRSLVSKRTLEVWDLDETVSREEVVSALYIALGKPDLRDQCRPVQLEIINFKSKKIG